MVFVTFENKQYDNWNIRYLYTYNNIVFMCVIKALKKISLFVLISLSNKEKSKKSGNLLRNLDHNIQFRYWLEGCKTL